MKNYAKVIDDKVVEIKIGTNNLKPAGVLWKPLEFNKPAFDNETEVLIIDNYTILEDKVIENYKVEPINFEPMPEDDNHDFID